MIIEKLRIYGFGKHENVEIELAEGMNVLYGVNEAGKTTIQQFILHILFGFPQRNSTTLRYEPKTGGKYGGQLQIYDELYGRCTVERVRGKSSGDVTVYFEDGARGGEDALKELLRQYDRTSFEAIFSFSLLQLQGFEKMDEDELSRTLLASGTTGVDSLLKLDVKMSKEIDTLFKKAGKNPLLNVKLQELRTLEVTLQEAQKEVAAYAPTIERIHQIDGKMEKLKSEKSDHEEILRQLTLERQLLPLYSKKETLKKRLAEINGPDFPADGIRRYESIAGKIIEAEAAQLRISKELADAEKAVLAASVSECMTEIDLLLARESEWHHWRSTRTTCNDELKQLRTQKQSIIERLGIVEQANSTLLQANVSIHKEEELHALLGELDRVNNEIGYVESQFLTVKNELERIQEQTNALVQPTAEEIKTAHEWPSVRQRLAEANAYIAYGGKKQQPIPLFTIMMTLAAILFIGVGFFQQQFLIVGVGVLLAGIGVALYVKKEPTIDPKIAEMQRFSTAYKGREGEMESLLHRVGEFEREKERLTIVSSEFTQKENELEVELEALDRLNLQIKTNLNTFMKEYGIEALPAPSILPEIFRMIREMQKVARRIEEVTQKLQETEAAIVARMKAAEKALQQAVPEEAVYELLRRDFIRLSEQAEKQKQMKEKIDHLKPAKNEANMLIESLKIKISTLFSEAGVESEEAFYQAYNDHQEKVMITGQIKDLDMQLAIQPIEHTLAQRVDRELVSEMVKLEEAMKLNNEKTSHYINEKAALVNKAKQLLTDESLSEKRQDFEMKKAELDNLAKEWSARKAVSAAIYQMMNELKETQLPDVLLEAEKIFGKLTGGQYSSIAISEQGNFEVLTIAGLRFSIVELSQATKEQAYIALRFALATSILSSAPFPIIMDDPFVHFDEERLSSMIEVLNETKQHQFIYFTCDKRMKSKWQDATIIDVSTIRNEQGASAL